MIFELLLLVCKRKGFDASGLGGTLCHAMPNRTLATVSLFAFLYLASLDARAQEARSFEQLQLLVKAGDRIFVTDPTLNTFEGRIAGLSTSSLRVMVNGSSRDLSETDIFEIRQWRHDSLKNGAVIGAGVGLGLGIAFAVAICQDSWSGCGGGEVLAGLALYSAIGAGIGVGVDALIPSKQRVYIGGTRTSANRISLMPILNRSRQGIKVGFSF